MYEGTKSTGCGNEAVSARAQGGAQIMQAKSAQGMDCCGRQSGKDVIAEIIMRLRRRADNLETMLKMLPTQPTSEQDQHLWELGMQLQQG